MNNVTKHLCITASSVLIVALVMIISVAASTILNLSSDGFMLLTVVLFNAVSLILAVVRRMTT